MNELPPHQVWDIGGGQQFEQRELRGLLTQTYTRVIRDNGKVQGKEIELTQTPYDLGSRDPNYILKILTFHQAAGGESYTGVRHDFLHELDLSSQLRLGRAVLFGRIRHAASEWTVNGEKRAAEAPLTFVRLVLPVQQLEESTRTLVKPDEGLKLPAAK